MSKVKKQSIHVAYLPMSKAPGRSLTHYSCSGGKRGYVTLRRRDSESAQTSSENGGD